MEWHNWYVGQRQRREGLIPPCVKWDKLPGLYDKLAELTSHIPWKRRLILHLCFRGTRIKIDLGDVKAAGIVAVLGLSFGLGSLLLYRLYYRYVHTKDNIKGRKEEDETNEDECHIYLESTDDTSPNKRGMGNGQSSQGYVASVHYSPSYGVAIGPNYNNNKGGRPAWVRQRKLGSPGERLESLPELPKSRGRVPTTKSKRYASESESDTGLPFTGTEQWCHDVRTAKSRTALSPSLIVNCSPQSVQERRFHFSQSDTNPFSASGNYNLEKDLDGNRLNIGMLQDSSVLLTPPDEDYVPYVRSAPQSDQNSITEQSPLIDLSREQSPYSVGDSSSFYNAESPSQSLRSSSRLGESDENEGEFGTTSPLPRLSSLDRSFKHNLLKRLTEWTSLSQELGSASGSGSGSGSISPDVRSTPERRMKRSVTIGSTSSMSGIESPVSELVGGNDIGLRTSKNLEDIEDEIHQIFSEFDYLNSKLTDLKSRNNTSGRIEPLVPDDPEIMADTDGEGNDTLQEEIKEAYEHWCRHAQFRGLRGQSLPPIDSSGRLSSRGASFMERDLSWDAGDIGGAGGLFGGQSTSTLPSVWSAKDGESVEEVNKLTTMGEVFDDREWKQIEETTTRPPSTQLAESQLGGCRGSISPDDSSMTYDADESNVDCDISLDVSDATTQNANQNSQLFSVGEKIDMVKYAAQEWKGETAKSQAVRKGYEEVRRRTGLYEMRIIRGDNYCAIRASLFQLFNEGKTVKLSCQDVLQKIKTMIDDNTGGITGWNFANRIQVKKSELFGHMSACIQTFFNKVSECEQLNEGDEREAWVLAVFNSDTQTDLQLMEAVKLLMFIQAVELYRDNIQGNEVPSFVWLLFARDTSENPHLLLSNHINMIGDSGGLEQIEMCLLSYSLGVAIRVFRLSDVGKADFEATYSGDDDNSNHTDSLTLLAEDDRHYNVLVS